MLSTQFGLLHVAPGDLFRSEVRDRSEVGLLVEDILRRGDLVPDSITVRIISARLSSDLAKSGFVLDGFPRNLAQAVALDHILGDRGESLDLVIDIEVAEGVILERARTRRVCPLCGKPYNLLAHAPKVEGVCDDCGAALVTRPDDSEETVLDRLALHMTHEAPVLRYYEERGILRHIDGEGTVDQVFQHVMAALAKQNLLQ